MGSYNNIVIEKGIEVFDASYYSGESYNNKRVLLYHKNYNNTYIPVSTLDQSIYTIDCSTYVSYDSNSGSYDAIKFRLSTNLNYRSAPGGTEASTYLYFPGKYPTYGGSAICAARITSPPGVSEESETIGGYKDCSLRMGEGADGKEMFICVPGYVEGNNVYSGYSYNKSGDYEVKVTQTYTAKDPSIFDSSFFYFEQNDASVICGSIKLENEEKTTSLDYYYIDSGLTQHRYTNITTRWSVKSNMKPYYNNYYYFRHSVYYLIYRVKLDKDSPLYETTGSQWKWGYQTQNFFNIGSFTPYGTLGTLVGGFKLNLYVIKKKLEIPNLSKNYFNFTGTTSENAIIGTGGQGLDLSIYCIDSSYNKYIKNNNICFKISTLSTVTPDNIGTNLVTSYLDQDIENEWWYGYDASTSSGKKIGTYDASYNNQSAERMWSADNTKGLFVSIQPASCSNIVEPGLSDHINTGNPLLFNYDVHQAAPENVIYATRSSTTISGAKQTINDFFTVKYNIGWYISNIYIPFSIEDTNYKYNLKLKYQNSSVEIDSSSWTDYIIPEAHIKLYIEEYTKYLFDNISAKTRQGDESKTLFTQKIDLKTYSNTIIPVDNLNVNFVFSSISGISPTISSSVNYNQNKAVFNYFTDTALTQNIPVEYSIDSYRYDYSDSSTFYYYFNNECAAYKTWFEYGEHTSKNAAIKNANNKIFENENPSIYSVSAENDNYLNFSFPAAKTTDNESSYLLYSKGTGIDSSNKTYYLDSSLTSIWKVESPLTTFNQDEAILNIEYIGPGSAQSLSSSEQYPKFKVTTSNNFYLNKGDAEEYISLYGNWDSSSFNGYYKNNVSRNNNEFIINDTDAKELKLNENVDPFIMVDSSIVVWSGNSIAAVGDVPDNSCNIQIKQSPAAPTYIFDVYGKSEVPGATYQKITTGSTGHNFNKNGSDTFYLKISNTSNQSHTFIISSNSTDKLTINGKTSDEKSVEKNGEWTDISINVVANETSENRNFILTISNGNISHIIYFTQSGGTRGVSLTSASSLVDINFNELNTAIYIKNTGSIPANYRITGEDKFILFNSGSGSDSPSVLSEEIAADSSKEISVKITANNTDEKRSGYIVVEDIADAFTTNTRAGVVQKCHNKPIFFLTVYDANRNQIPSSSLIDGSSYFDVSIRSSLGLDSSVSMEVVTSEGCSVEPYGTDNNFPVYWGDCSMFKLLVNNNATNEYKEIYFTVNAYYDGIGVSSQTYTKNTPYTITFKLSVKPNADIALVGYDSGDYIKYIGGIPYYMFGPGIGSRTINIYDQNGGLCDWSTIEKYNMNENYSTNYIPASSASNSKLTISSINLNTEETDYLDSSFKVYVHNTLTNKDASAAIRIKRYPVPYFNSAFDSIISDVKNKELNYSIFNKKDYVDIDLYIDTYDASIDYTYSLIEYNTTGNEFSMSESKDDSHHYILRCPKNISLSSIKKCEIVFTYNYNNSVPDHASDRTDRLSVLVNPAPTPEIKLKDVDNNEFNSITYYNCDAKYKDASYGIDIKIDSTSCAFPISYEYSLSESGTSGAEFIVSNKDASTLNLIIPINTSYITNKICYLTVKSYYQGSSSNPQYSSKTIQIIVKPANKPTIYLNPDYYVYPGNIVDGSIDISVNIISDNSLNISYSVVSEEFGTTGNEFTLTKNNNVLHLSVPKNKSVDTKKVCNVTATCYYTEASEHLDDNYAIGTYIVNYVSGPIISFKDSSSITDISTSLTVECSEDSSSYSVQVFRINDPSMEYSDADRIELDKIELTYNSIKFGEINSDKIIYFRDNNSVDININIYDNEYDFSLYDYVNITGYDADNHAGITCKLKIEQLPGKNYCPKIVTSLVSVSATSDLAYYNLGFSHYMPSAEIINRDDFYIEPKEDSLTQYRILDYGFKIKQAESNNWTSIWNSKYKNELIFTGAGNNDTSIYKVYSGSLPYTNSVFKYSANKIYEYAAIAKVDYRNGKSSEWVTNALIEGEIKQFKLGEKKETNYEYIRPYFKPVEKINGYLTGTEIKNFINSKGIVFNRNKAKTIDITNWYSNYSLNNKNLTLNVNNALIDLILHSSAFNKAWKYIKDSTNIIDAKKLYIKNNILSNIIINSSCVLDVYYDPNSTNLGLLSEYDSDLVKIENISNELKYIAESDSYTMNIVLPENKQYCVILHLKY